MGCGWYFYLVHGWSFKTLLNCYVHRKVAHTRPLSRKSLGHESETRNWQLFLHPSGGPPASPRHPSWTTLLFIAARRPLHHHRPVLCNKLQASCNLLCVMCQGDGIRILWWTTKYMYKLKHLAPGRQALFISQEIIEWRSRKVYVLLVYKMVTFFNQ